MQQQLLYGVAVVPAVIGLTQIAKTAGLPNQFAPIIAVVLGILAGLAEMYGTQWPIIQTIVVGVGLGLSSVGLYSAGSTVYTHVSTRNDPPQTSYQSRLIMPHYPLVGDGGSRQSSASR